MMSEGAERSYLSIGEVLGLLLEEFPDVTISKIRFLESQGLIDPERTPAGYRKFYEADVELLRVILREQRENFLPLRVIKDRIHSGEIDPSGEIEAPDQLSFDMSPAPSDTGHHTEFQTNAVPVGADDAELGAGHGRRHDVMAVVAESDAMKPRAVGPETSDTPDRQDASDTVDPAVRDSHGVGSSPPGNRTLLGAPASADAVSDSEPSAVTAAGVLSGVVLDRSELCSIAQISDAELDDLVRFGLLSGHDSGGLVLYDDESVEVARACAEFLRAGVDARHLRGWRLAVDREITLYEQMVAPRLRQRSPAARADVHSELQRLDRLGSRLRAALMARALRNYRPG
jgi:DNA-binding transcriptional MerR regulator